MRYLQAFLLKPTYGDASNKGISSIPDATYYIPCEDGIYTEQELKDLKVFNPNIFILEYSDVAPFQAHFKEKDTLRQPMFGGCFLHTSDARFGKSYGRRPVHLFDRFEQ